MNYYIVVAAVGLLIGLSKGGLGGPVPISLVTPLLSQVMPVSNAVGVVLPLLMVADLFALRAYWREWNMHYIRLLLPMALVGLLAGTLVLASLTDLDLRRILGGFTLIAVLYKLASANIAMLAYKPRGWHGYVAGVSTGFGSALANAGAPPFTAYMLLQDLPPRTFIGTTTLFFAILNACKLPGYLQTGALKPEQFAGIAWTLPLLPVGVWIANKIMKRINPVVFEWIMVAALLWASVALLFTVPAR